MKKEMIILALVLLLSFSIVQATEKTKVYGNVEDIAATIKISVTYKADNIEYSQSVTRNPDDDGIWSYIFYCDSGYLVKTTVDINSRLFDLNVTCGKELRIAWLNGQYIISDGTTVSSSGTTTTTTTTSNSSSTNTTTTNTTTTVTTSTNSTSPSSENKTSFFSNLSSKVFNKNLWKTIGKILLIIIGAIIVLGIIYYAIRWFRNRPAGEIKTISFSSKFGADKELDKAEARLEQVQAEIESIKNRDKKMHDIHDRLRNAEKELERLKSVKKGEFEF